MHLIAGSGPDDSLSQDRMQIFQGEDMLKSPVQQVVSHRAVRLGAGAATRRAFAASTLALLGALSLTQVAGAQNYPNRNVRIIIPFSAGGGADVLLRIVANALSERWKQSVIVENRVGGNTVIGTVAAINSPPDGYTLYFAGDQTITINPGLTTVPYKVERDLVPITQVANNPMLLVVNKSVPANTLQEFIALAKSKPKSITFGSSGAGSIQRMIMENFAQAAGIEMVHVPYRGSNETVAGMLAGDIHATFNGVSNFVELLKADRLRALAIATRERSPQLPDVPAAWEAGGEKLRTLQTGSWFGFFAPAGTPAEIVAQVRQDVADVLATPQVKQAVELRGFQPVANSPAEFAQVIRDETARWAQVIKDGNIKAD
jgi:tripartite-type tricarboxylate transporter receptor subunit TctC